MADVIITPASGLIDFQNTSGISSASFQLNANGNLDFTGNLNISGVSTFGDTLKVYNSGNDSYIDNVGTGSLYIRDTNGTGTNQIIIQARGGENSIVAVDDGQVELYYDAVKKFETTTSGVKATGNIVLTGELDFGGTPSNKYVDFYTKDSGGTPYSATLRLVNHDSTSFNFAVNMIRDGAVELYHSGTKKFETISTGATVTGNMYATAYYGDGSNLQNVGGTPGGTEGAVQYNSSSALAGIATLMSIDSTNFNVGIGTRIDIVPYDTQDNGTLSFEGSAGQLFSITNSLTSGSIFSVNDVSGIPSIDVDADGTIQLAPFGATEYVGIGTTNPSEKLHVNGGNIAVTDGAIITDQNIDANITIPSGKNGLLIGPTTVGVGVTIDVASGSTLVVV